MTTKTSPGTHTNPHVITLIAALLLLFSFSPAFGQYNFWTNTLGGLWYVDNNWLLNVPPAAGQSVVINNAGIKTVTIDATAAGSYPATMTIGSLSVGFPNTLVLATGGSATPLAVTSGFGLSPGGTLNITNSSLVTTGSITIDGTINISGGTWTSGASRVYVGQGGGGYLNLYDGVVSTAQLTVGTYNTGTVSHVGGLMNATNMSLASGATTKGTYNQWGGTNQIGGYISAADSQTAVANYNLYGGTLDYRNGSFMLGGRGEATFYQSGGKVLGQYTYLASGSGTGTYNLDSGLVTNVSLINGSGGTGILNQNGGTNLCESYAAGSWTSTKGTYNLFNGSFGAVWGYLGSGAGSTGIFNHSYGSVSMRSLQLASGAGSVGIYNYTNGTVNIGDVWLGTGGAGIFNHIGGYNCTITNQLVIGSSSGGSGFYNLINGSLTTGWIQINNRGNFALTGGTVIGPVSINPGGSFTMNSGSLSSNVNNQGTFTYTAGNFAGRLINYGFVDFGSTSFPINGGLLNYGTLVLPPPGISLTAYGTGIDNEGSLELNNSFVYSGSSIVNNGLITGYGILSANGAISNNAQIVCSGGSLTLNGYLGMYNSGMMTLASGYQLRLSTTVYNDGSLDLNGGTVAGDYYNLLNRASGVMTGPGTVHAYLSNQGLIYLDHGTLSVPGGFDSSGAIMLAGDTANLGGGTIVNTGSIQGRGTMATAINNGGTIEPIDGTLVLAQPVANTSSGLLTAGAGTKLLVNGAFTSNEGLINLRGGTFDIGNKGFNNFGQVSGWGTFRAGFTNSGTVTLTGGPTTVNGNINNAPFHRITVADTPALFTGSVVNSGQFKVTATTVRFSGSYTENGVYSSDPATNQFADLAVGTTGYLLGDTRDAFVISGNLSCGSLQSNAWNTAHADLSFKGGTAHTFQLPGRDAGAVLAGYAQNFAWNSVRLGAGETLLLADGNAVPGAALYTRKFILEGGLGQLGSVSGNGYNIYYDPSEPENNYLNSGTYDLAGGGKVMPIAAPIRILSVALTPAGAVLNCTGKPEAAHTILGSTNLANWSALGSATADVSGSFNYTDTAATNFLLRFYRLSVP